jgi:hypothetical protein
MGEAHRHDHVDRGPARSTVVRGEPPDDVLLSRAALVRGPAAVVWQDALGLQRAIGNRSTAAFLHLQRDGEHRNPVTVQAWRVMGGPIRIDPAFRITPGGLAAGKPRSQSVVFRGDT